MKPIERLAFSIKVEGFKAFAKNKLIYPIQLSLTNARRVNSGQLLEENKTGSSKITVNDSNEIVAAQMTQAPVCFSDVGLTVRANESFSHSSYKRNHTGTSIVVKSTNFVFDGSEQTDIHKIQQTVVNGNMESQFEIIIDGKSDIGDKLLLEYSVRASQIGSVVDLTQFNYFLVWDPKFGGYKLGYENKSDPKLKKDVAFDESVVFTKKELGDMGFTHLPEEINIVNGAIEVEYLVKGKKVKIYSPSDVPTDIENNIIFKHKIIPHRVNISK